MTTASDVLTPVFEVLEDTDHDYYTVAQGVKWLNEAQYAVRQIRPDLSSAVENVLLVAGTKQTLAAGNAGLLAVGSNMGADGATPGKAIKGPVSRKALEAVNSDWRTDSSSTTVRTLIYDPAAPLTYYVHPPVPESPDVYIELTLDKIPAACADESASIALRDDAIPALRKYVLASFYSRSSERTPNWTKARAAFQDFFLLLGADLKAKLAWDPRLTEHQWRSQPTS